MPISALPIRVKLDQEQRRYCIGHADRLDCVHLWRDGGWISLTRRDRALVVSPWVDSVPEFWAKLDLDPLAYTMGVGVANVHYLEPFGPNFTHECDFLPGASCGLRYVPQSHESLVAEVILSALENRAERVYEFMVRLADLELGPYSKED